MKVATNAKIRDHFLGWQCRVRQHAMRFDQGRPSEAMRPSVFRPGGELIARAITVLIVPEEPEEHTDFFRFQVQKTNDPRVRYERGLAYLQSTYFQKPALFSDEMTALFSAGSKLAQTIAGAGEVLLEFDAFAQNYKMMCAVRKLAQREAAYQATLWHNRMFNPDIPNGAVILGLKPQWRSAQAHPEP